MLRSGLALLALVLAVSSAGCQRSSRGPSIPAQPIRDEKEPGETVDTIGAVPDSSGSSRDFGSSDGGTEIDLEESSSSASETSKDTSGSSTSSETAEEEGGGDGDGEGGADPGDVDIDIVGD